MPKRYVIDNGNLFEHFPFFHRYESAVEPGEYVTVYMLNDLPIGKYNFMRCHCGKTYAEAAE